MSYGFWEFELRPHIWKTNILSTQLFSLHAYRYFGEKYYLITFQYQYPWLRIQVKILLYLNLADLWRPQFCFFDVTMSIFTIFSFIYIKGFFILCTYHSSPSLPSSSSHPHTLSPQTPTSAPPKRSQQNLADQVKARPRLSKALTTFYIKRKDVRDTQNING